MVSLGSLIEQAGSDFNFEGMEYHDFRDNAQAGAVMMMRRGPQPPMLRLPPTGATGEAVSRPDHHQWRPLTPPMFQEYGQSLLM